MIPAEGFHSIIVAAQSFIVQFSLQQDLILLSFSFKRRTVLSLSSKLSHFHINFNSLPIYFDTINKYQYLRKARAVLWHPLLGRVGGGSIPIRLCTRYKRTHRPIEILKCQRIRRIVSRYICT